MTFGGAYAVLAYVAQRAVETYHWLAPGEMVRGLPLAESTPGPLIMVVQFVAFVGAYRDPSGLDPWAAGLLGALVTTWVTFVPCLVFIFLGALYVEHLRSNRAVRRADRHHRRRRRRHRQPRPLLRPAHPLRYDDRALVGAGAAGGPGPPDDPAGLARHHADRRLAGVPPALVRAPDTRTCAALGLAAALVGAPPA
ncbi:MAG TPA: chromate transporter [Mycobacteriales bacterium]|nr:chromate transporter [Mycobacteriales bacterium]